jgi:hypothetical protein
MRAVRPSPMSCSQHNITDGLALSSVAREMPGLDSDSIQNYVHSTAKGGCG